MENNKIQEAILKTIKLLLEEESKNLHFNRTVYGTVKVDNLDGTYIITINDSDTVLKAVEGLNLQVNDVVVIMVNNNNYSDKFILCKRP